MTRIKVGWPALILALIVFILGFCAGAVYRNGAAPVAHSATPPMPVTQPARTVHLVDATEVVKLSEQVSGMRQELGQVNATLKRIEAAITKR